MAGEPVLSRHRLPRGYRWSLATLWFAPVVLIFLSALAGRGISLSLIDPRFLLPLALMAVPALYVWREGIDVLPDGLMTRIYWPRYYPYTHLETWYMDDRPLRRVLTIWDSDNRKVFEHRIGHLTDLPLLVCALKANIRYRNWPN